MTPIDSVVNNYLTALSTQSEWSWQRGIRTRSQALGKTSLKQKKASISLAFYVAVSPSEATTSRYSKSAGHPETPFLITSIAGLCSSILAQSIFGDRWCRGKRGNRPNAAEAKRKIISASYVFLFHFISSIATHGYLSIVDSCSESMCEF